ncbi:MAG: 3-deoxy-D-manno-octulosonic acid transferase [Burkholderiales bacterium]|nr:3-deoxy-D-manno-octulosonic acid transferase [Burkholderiales bacterium]
MMRWLYACFMGLAQPLLRRKLRQRGVREPGYLDAVEERFGRYALPPLPADGRTIWVHAVSLGETRAAAVLLARLREALPQMRLLLTHGTATGRAEGKKLLRAGDVQAWLPWDTPGAVQRFLAHFQPRIGILMETEVWPNLVAACVRAKVPLVLANARLSEKSMRQAQRLAWLSRPAYRSLAAVWAQTQDDAARFAALGAPVRGVFGNLKFDAMPNAEQLAQGRAWRATLGQPVVMFASSREGEEVEFLQVLKDFRASSLAGVALNAPDLIADQVRAVQWLIVPRHPQRFNEVAALIESQGFTLSRRSQWGAPPATAQSAAVWLGDSLGEMALYYGLSDAALLGGSFAPLGGQNLIEAAACACPVLMGPHTFNFSEAAELAQSAGAASRHASLHDAVVAACGLVTDGARRADMAAAASRFAQAHRGATDQTVAAVRGLLG